VQRRKATETTVLWPSVLIAMVRPPRAEKTRWSLYCVMLSPMQQDKTIKVLLSISTLYLAWSSTYLAIRIALEQYPPFFIAGFRYLLVGVGMYLYLRYRGVPPPTKREWGWSAVIGMFLLLGGTAGVVYAEQWVGSGLAALMLATTPLWTVLFGGTWRNWPARLEWLGILVGFSGIVVLNLGGDLRAHPLGAALLMLAALSWSFGSVLSLQVPRPADMMAGAAQMATGGLLVLAVGFGAGERVPAHAEMRPTAALIYLAIFGSLLGYTAYTYLLNNVRPALATSYAYVNPVLAVLLGAWIGGEPVTATTLAALPVILAGVVLVVIGHNRGARVAAGSTNSSEYDGGKEEC
jgi:drug/metabolite transporter (DMT)-like permease